MSTEDKKTYLYVDRCLVTVLRQKLPECLTRGRTRNRVMNHWAVIISSHSGHMCAE